MLTYGRPLLMGLLGFACAWAAWHLKIDHDNLHALIDSVVQAQAQAQQKVAAAQQAQRSVSEVPPSAP